jgi:hypothetical protein
MIFLNPTAISRLLCCGRQTARDRILGGGLGPVLRHGRGIYVHLADVERHTGLKFSPAQIELAVDGRSERRLVLPQLKPEGA